MQKFTKKYHEKFINHFNIKKSHSEIETAFLEKTEKYLKFIKFIPGIRMAGIGNSISMNCSSKNSDIDLFIVTTNNSMWFNRIIVTFIFKILGVRKTKNKHAGRFCLSFFSTLDGLDFSYWKIKNDIYLYFWIIYFKPILDYNNTYSLFLEKNSYWANFDNYKDIIDKNKSFIKYKKNISKNSDFIVKNLDNLFKKIFLPKTIKSYNNLNKPYGIIINNNLLKFHDKDIREKIKDKLL